ncbi:MAG: ABC transporter ATP-binding protein [Termitinemataceae bacterium]|nr:MAG: ABC transporter ATP-binding protein [Termitinemataceae bacterium]
MSDKTQEILRMNHVCKNFGGITAIDDFNCVITEGQVHGLIGPNGAGKTTIFNNISGIYSPDGGNIIFLDKDITGAKPHTIASSGIARTFQNIRLFQNLSALDNIITASSFSLHYTLFDAICRTPKYRAAEKVVKEKSLALLESVGLSGKVDELAGKLPYGHQRKLEIARALALNPKLILLDEPAAGMNGAESNELVDFIKKIHDTFHLTILLIEHHIDVVTQLCDMVTVLNFGKTICCGSSYDIRRDARVVEAYIGKSVGGLD